MTPVRRLISRRVKNPKVVVQGRSRTLTEAERDGRHVRPPVLTCGDFRCADRSVVHLARRRRAVAQGLQPFPLQIRRELGFPWWSLCGGDLHVDGVWVGLLVEDEFDTWLGRAIRSSSARVLNAATIPNPR